MVRHAISMIAAIIVGLMLAAIAVDAFADDKMDGCLPVPLLQHMVKESSGYSNLRALEGEKATKALQFFADVSQGDEGWTTAFLLDAKDGSGTLIVGMSDMACKVLTMDDNHWRAFLAFLDGQGT